jgi:uncharacterized protein involved in exopolysaccharide biosynthesis
MLVTGVVIVAASAALLFGLLREPVYTAEATVNIKPREELIGNDDRGAFMDDVIRTVATEDLLRGVMRQAGWQAGLAEFRERLEVDTFVSRSGETGLRVQFSDPQPERAARAANAYAELFVEKVERLNDERLAGGALAADASVERKATPPGGSGLRLLLYAAVAATVGLLVGGGLALLLEGRARSWRGARDAELTLRAPVLGVIPDYSSLEEG